MENINFALILKPFYHLNNLKFESMQSWNSVLLKVPYLYDGQADFVRYEGEWIRQLIKNSSTQNWAVR